MGGLLHLVQQEGAWVGCGPTQSSPRCTKCNSPPTILTASVPTSYYSMWHYNYLCTLKRVKRDRHLLRVFLRNRRQNTGEEKECIRHVRDGETVSPTGKQTTHDSDELMRCPVCDYHVHINDDDYWPLSAQPGSCRCKATASLNLWHQYVTRISNCRFAAS